ncbi:MAG: PqqD family protein [Actinomycetia bacterium]|nr:PqqD family protein [Actinomycetes bacterium]
MLLSPASDGEPVLLDVSARLIWECLVEPVSVDELASDIADQFQTDKAEVRTVLQSTIAQLADQLLVEEA